MKHTKLPWKINKKASFLIEAESRSIGSVGGYSDGAEDTHFENKANAAFIVKAVNSFDNLLKALKDLEFESSFAENKHYDLEDSIMRAEKAIKQAEGDIC